MKHIYLLASILLVALSQQALGQATAWRPFRPGLVYAFAQAASPTVQHTLRVDSAYATAGGDSVYAFNRLLRPLSNSSTLYAKSRNNLLGARLRWQPGTRDFYLEANVESIIGAAQAVTLLLRPRAAVGSIWAASISPALTATLSSRSYGLVGSAPDSLATITLSNGQALIISKHYGLVQGPQWLTLTASSSTWYQPSPPRAGLSFYDPQQVFALNAGDELGYSFTDYAFGSGGLVCSQAYLLRRISNRQTTADSLIVRYSQQKRTSTSGAPGCSAAGTSVSSVSTGRWAFSLNTGRSPQFSPFTLLTNEYTAASLGSSNLFTGRSITARMANNSCFAWSQIIGFVPMYPYQSQTNVYFGGLDDAAYLDEFSPSAGLGPITLGSSINRNYSLVYYSHNSITCGSNVNFATLLPSRAAQAAAAATLHPNPATDAATLTLSKPAPPGSTLVLTDALGRLVWRADVAASQTELPIPLTNQPGGLYLVQLLAPGAAPLTWKLQH